MYKIDLSMSKGEVESLHRINLIEEAFKKIMSLDVDRVSFSIDGYEITAINLKHLKTIRIDVKFK
jgi:hypothetical protein